jgi:hypothetical protein
MVTDEDVKAALMAVVVRAVGEMTEERVRVELEGAGGLSVRVLKEERTADGGDWRLSAKRQGTGFSSTREGAWERLHLIVEDRHGERLAQVASEVKQPGEIAGAVRSGMLERLVADLVEGRGGNKMALGVLLVKRAADAQQRLRDLEVAVKAVPRALADKQDAMAAAVWAEGLARETEAPSA